MYESDRVHIVYTHTVNIYETTLYSVGIYPTLIRSSYSHIDICSYRPARRFYYIYFQVLTTGIHVSIYTLAIVQYISTQNSLLPPVLEVKLIMSLTFIPTHTIFGNIQ